jgi:hypothetical protein
MDFLFFNAHCQGEKKTSFLLFAGRKGTCQFIGPVGMVLAAKWARRRQPDPGVQVPVARIVDRNAPVFRKLKIRAEKRPLRQRAGENELH